LMFDPEKISRQSWPRYFLLAFCSFLLSFAVLEGLLRWRDVADPPAFENNPSFGYRMQPNQSVSPRGYRFHINNTGLRGRDVLMPKPTGIYRIAFLGDSITYGGGSVHEEDLFANRVASSLGSTQGRQVEAINISVPGWGPQNIAGYVSSVGVYDADLIVWVIPSCDFRRHKTTLEEIGEPQKATKLRLAYLFQVGWDRLRMRFDGLSSRTNTDSGPETLHQNLQAFHTTANQLIREGIPIALVTVPYEWGYTPSADLAEYQAAARSCTIPFLDSAPFLLSRGSKRVYIDGVHLNDQGHKVLAEAITNFLEKNFFERPLREQSKEQCSVRE
jgi:hypothetical protein